MRKKLKSYLTKLKASDGAFTAEGSYLSRGEVFHTFLPSLFLAILNMRGIFMALMTLVTSGSKLSGHLGDFKKNMAYGVAGFGVGKAIEILWPVIL